MMSNAERLVWIGAFLIVIAGSLIPYFLTPKPYWGVRLVETRQEGGYRYLTVNFIKGECERRDVVFLGHRLGTSDDLTQRWEPLDGVEDDHDRLAGAQTLSGRIYTGQADYEAFEIRTRHTCQDWRGDDVRVNRTSLTIEVTP